MILGYQNIYKQFFNKQLHFISTLKNKELQVIKDYTYENYINVNKYLRHSVNSSHDTEMDNIVKVLDDVFKKVPPTNEDVIVYRGVKFETQVPTDFIDRGYVSTSTDKRIALNISDYECCVFKIIIPSGSHVLPIINCTYYPNELEVLLPLNSEFGIVGRKDNKVYVEYIEHLNH